MSPYTVAIQAPIVHPRSLFFRASAVGECKAETRYDIDEGHDEDEMQV